jgi:hypothetical protein
MIGIASSPATISTLPIATPNSVRAIEILLGEKNQFSSCELALRLR